MNEPKKFTIKGNGDFITISILEIYGYPNETSFRGGYDIKSEVEISVGNYNCRGSMYITTGDIYSFYQDLRTCYGELNGELKLETIERNLELELKFNQGHVNVYGSFREHPNTLNQLNFEIESDQTFIKSTLNELLGIVTKYGGIKGVSETHNKS